MCAGVGSGGRFWKVPGSSGVCLLQVLEAGSGRFRTVPMCAGAGSGGKFRKVPVCAIVGSGGRFRRVPVCAGLGTGGRVRKVPESYGVVCCFATLSGAAMWLFWTPFGDNIVHMGRTTAQKKWRSCSQTWQKDYVTAVGDTTKAYCTEGAKKSTGSHCTFCCGVSPCWALTGFDTVWSEFRTSAPLFHSNLFGTKA